MRIFLHMAIINSSNNRNPKLEESERVYLIISNIDHGVFRYKRDKYSHIDGVKPCLKAV